MRCIICSGSSGSAQPTINQRRAVIGADLSPDQVAAVYQAFGVSRFCRGDVIKGNFYKCGDKTAHKHYLSWSPIDLDSPNCHCPEYFGVIRFGE